MARVSGPLTLLLATLNNLHIRPTEVVSPILNPIIRPVVNPIINSFRWSPPIADTKVGRVMGTVEVSRDGEKYYVFKGIPYATPPEGHLRFEPPLPHEGWDGVYRANTYKSCCWQISLLTRQPEGDENCLYLNVYTKKVYVEGTLSHNNDTLHPVIVFIHGGLFMTGSADIFRERYFMDEDVVLVTFNYRLASFGFLNTGDGWISGNMGLKDQVLALQWVQDNIKYFNGDPSRVTIMGESAGSVCSHLHTMSPMSKGLFANVISQSGTALAPWGLMPEPAIQAQEFIQGVGCTRENVVDVMNCLKSLPARELALYHVGYIIAAAEGKHTLFGPTIESTKVKVPFLPDHPLELMKNGNLTHTPWLTGVNSADGLVHLIPILRSQKLRKQFNYDWDHFAPLALSYDSEPDKGRISEAVWNYYMKNKLKFKVGSKTVKRAARMMSDRNFFLDSHDAALLQSHAAPTYIYYYTYEGLFSGANLLFSRTPLPLPGLLDTVVAGGINWVTSNVFQQKRDNNIGICHGDEMALLFSVPVYMRREITRHDVDYEFSKKLIKIWVSFARTGVPDPKKAGEDLQWPSVKETNPDLEDISLERMHLDRNFAMIREPFYHRMQFWKNHSFSYI